MVLDHLVALAVEPVAIKIFRAPERLGKVTQVVEILLQPAIKVEVEVEVLAAQV